MLALVAGAQVPPGIFAHQIAEELAERAGGAAAGVFELRIAAATGAPLYVASLAPTLFTALVRLGAAGKVSFVTASAAEAKMSLIGVKAPHPLLRVGADATKTHMLPMRVVAGRAAGGGRFEFVGEDESATRFVWWPASEAGAGAGAAAKKARKPKAAAPAAAAAVVPAARAPKAAKARAPKAAAPKSVKAAKAAPAARR